MAEDGTRQVDTGDKGPQQGVVPLWQIVTESFMKFYNFSVPCIISTYFSALMQQPFVSCPSSYVGSCQTR